MTTTPIYIKSLEIDNIKTFGEKVLLEFENPDGILPQWTLIIGDNGLGKSTLLQLIAWMKPILPYDKNDTKGFIQTPIIMDEQNEVLTQLVRKSGRHIVAKISAIYTAQRSLNQKARKQVSKPIICKTEISIEVENETLVDVIVPKQKKNENDVFYKEEILIYAYSATRNLGKLNVR